MHLRHPITKPFSTNLALITMLIKYSNTLQFIIIFFPAEKYIYVPLTLLIIKILLLTTWLPNIQTHLHTLALMYSLQ